MQAGESYGAGHAVAIFAQALKRGVARFGEVHLRAGDQIVEIARRDAGSAGGVGKGRQDRMRRRRRRRRPDRAGRASAPEPRVFSATLSGAVAPRRAWRIGDIIHQAHERVEGAEGVALGAAAA